MIRQFGLLFIFILAISVAGFGQCSPTFQEVYGFQPGTVLQYEGESWSPSEKGESHTKVTVSGIDISGDTMRIKFSGWTRLKRTTINYSSPVATDVFPLNYVKMYIDSANHYLNGCDGELVHFCSNCLGGYPQIYSILDATIGSGVEQKEIHAVDGNLFFDNSLDSVLSSWDEWKTEIYRKGLGLVFENEVGFEFSFQNKLVGHIVDGDTSGNVLPDAYYYPTGINSPASESSIQLFPTSVTSGQKVTIQSAQPIDHVTVYSMQGSQQSVPRVTNNSLNLDNLAKGIYLVHVETDNARKVFRVVKL